VKWDSRQLSRNALQQLIDTNLDALIGDPTVFGAVLDSCTVDDLGTAAGRLGYVLTRRFSGVHTNLPGPNGWACSCGWQGPQPCQWGPHSAMRMHG
jgi:hypothetical protein